MFFGSFSAFSDSRHRHHYAVSSSSYYDYAFLKPMHPLVVELNSLLGDETILESVRATKLKALLTRIEIEQANCDPRDKPDINKRISAHGNTALTRALYNRDIDSAQALLNANANPNNVGRYDASPLVIASYHGLKSCVTQLLEKKAAVNAQRTHDRLTALQMAAHMGNTDIVNILLVNGADHTAMNDDGDTALDLVVSRGGCALSTIKLLLEKGAVIENPSKMQKFLMSQDQNNEDVKYCYTKLTQHSISSIPNTSTQWNTLTISDIISRIEMKIEESRLNDKGFLSLFRDTVFSSNQIKIANELITRLNDINQQLPSDQLKTKITSEFETALIAFNILLANKTKGLVGTRALDPGAEKSMAGTRFHATILELMKAISNSDITPDSHIAQDNIISGDGATSFELKNLAPR